MSSVEILVQGTMLFLMMRNTSRLINGISSPVSHNIDAKVTFFNAEI